MNLDLWVEYCTNRHDVVCNQKYSNRLPYSFHLEMVYNTAKQLIDLFPGVFTEVHTFKIYVACWGHDLIEDARLTYNDIAQKLKSVYPESDYMDMTEMIFLCTEMRGRNRDERHSDEFYETLFEHHLATFVKLCDIFANIKYSTLNGSTMLKRYKTEFPEMVAKMPRHISVPFEDVINIINTELNIIPAKETVG